MTSATAADYLDCSLSYVSRLCRNGVLKFKWIKKGRKYRDIEYASVAKLRVKRFRKAVR